MNWLLCFSLRYKGAHFVYSRWRSRLKITHSDWEAVRSHYYVQRKISKDAIALLKNVSDRFYPIPPTSA
ncbi:hypothetical protein H6F61_28110 [Cyanobacteria bacterium FACHB-472]|nr:hypothetical protein [Cyanobacteria bacterium FACHB-472]